MVCALPATCFAAGDPIVPVLFLGTGMMFTLGQLWITPLKYLGLQRLYPALPKLKVFRRALFANAASTCIGALAIPFVLTVWGNKELEAGNHESPIFIAGWMHGFEEPALIVRGWMLMTLCLLLCCLISIWIEYRILVRFQREQSQQSGISLLRRISMLNILSYAAVPILCVFIKRWLVDA
jgi:hypothetical protein